MKTSVAKGKILPIIGGAFLFIVGIGIGNVIPQYINPVSIQNSPQNPIKATKLPEASYSLEDIIDQKKSPAFACDFGTYTVEMVHSQYKDHKYFKVNGSGILLNTGFLHTTVASNPNIIYAVPKDSPITNGSTLSAFCISNFTSVPYEGKERANIDKTAAVMTFYLLN